MTMTSDPPSNPEIRPHVIWFTNMAPPYRQAVWERLADHVDLTVALLMTERQFRRKQRRGNRGSDWLPEDNASYEVLSLRTLTVTAMGRPWFLLLRKPKKLMRPNTNAVLLGGWEQPAYLQLRRWAAKEKLRTVGFYESTAATARYKTGKVAQIRRAFFQALSAVVVPGIASRQALQDLGVAPEKIYEGFNAIDVEAFKRPARSAADAFSRGSGHRVLYVGQLIERKNVEGLLRAVATIDAGHTVSIVGQGTQEDELRTLCAELGLLDRAIFLGPVSYERLPELMWAHDTLVLPSHEEVWGLVVNEALAAGMHVVVSSRAGVAASVREMDGVWLSDTDPGGIARALECSISNWSGHIVEPAIMSKTPGAFASVFANAIAGDDKGSRPVVGS